MNTESYRKMGNVKILRMEKDLILEDIKQRFINRIKTRVFFINAHCFNVAQKNLIYRNQVNEAEYVLNDGIGVELGGRFFKIDLKENLNGTDFTPEVLQIINDLGKKIYLFGGKPGIAETASVKIKQDYPNIEICGYADGYSHDQKEIVDKINQAKPDLLLVGLGVPIQENWISEYYNQIDASVIMAVGAFLDFTAGTIKRAPLLIRKCRLEWLFRLVLEPRRLYKRYLIGNITFFYHVIKLAK